MDVLFEGGLELGGVIKTVLCELCDGEVIQEDSCGLGWLELIHEDSNLGLSLDTKLNYNVSTRKRCYLG